MPRPSSKDCLKNVQVQALHHAHHTTYALIVQYQRSILNLFYHILYIFYQPLLGKQCVFLQLWAALSKSRMIEAASVMKVFFRRDHQHSGIRFLRKDDQLLTFFDRARETRGQNPKGTSASRHLHLSTYRYMQLELQCRHIPYAGQSSGFEKKPRDPHRAMWRLSQRSKVTVILFRRMYSQRPRMHHKLASKC